MNMDRFELSEHFETAIMEKLQNRAVTKKDIVKAVSEVLKVELKSSDAHICKESGCDDWFSIDKQINENTDAYVEVYFKRNGKLFEVTEVDIDINQW